MPPPSPTATAAHGAGAVAVDAVHAAGAAAVGAVHAAGEATDAAVRAVRAVAVATVHVAGGAVVVVPAFSGAPFLDKPRARSNLGHRAAFVRVRLQHAFQEAASRRAYPRSGHEALAEIEASGL